MVTILAVADTDSYLKWSVSTLARLPYTDVVQVVLQNPVAPSAGQRHAAGAASAPVVTRRTLTRMVDELRPDAVLLGCTGPVVASLLDCPWARRPDRPVLVTGLPGISIPPTSRALRYRAGCDLFVLHSRREIAEFSDLAQLRGVQMRFGLARLPFLPEGPVRDPGRVGRDVLLAAQAKVPREREDREAVLEALVAHGHGAVKLRAASGEQQTHHERLPYPELYAELVAAGRVPADSVRFVSGAMHDALSEAAALVTVSSTAALEAMAAGVPVLLIDDFGVSPSMINTVFAGSGCFGSLADLVEGRFHRPDPTWLDQNYFHPASADDVSVRLGELLEQRGRGPLSAPVRVSDSVRARWRRRLRLSPALLTGRRWVRSLVRAARGRTAPAPLPDHLGS